MKSKRRVGSAHRAGLRRATDESPVTGSHFGEPCSLMADVDPPCAVTDSGIVGKRPIPTRRASEGSVGTPLAGASGWYGHRRP
jgi:hypothetical protein